MRNERARSTRAICTAIALCLATASLLAAQSDYKTAAPGYQYSFPRDNFSHPEFQTEWWYYTGNVKTADGHAFGFQLTFFRQGVDRNAQTDPSSWTLGDLYLAHLALSDIGGQSFYHVERLNRAGPGIAGVDAGTGRIWNGNWQIIWRGDHQDLAAVADNFTMHLAFDSRKPPVIHGLGGISQKAEGAGHASHYISLTRLATSGNIEIAGKQFAVTGTAWMDHEFFTQQLAADQVGWDWLSLQLDDNAELMVYRLRKKDGTIDPYSSGTFVDANGKSSHLPASAFSLMPSSAANWTSPTSHAHYPVRWHITAPSLGLDLDITTPLAQQEMTGASALAPTYWEGAIRITGARGHATVTGVGYLEMTGYDHPINLHP